MKAAEEMDWAANNLKEVIRSLIDEFVNKHGECSVEIHSSANFIEVGRNRSVYAGHDVEVNILIYRP